jgi:hypothetical protein
VTRMPARDADYLPLAMRLRQHGATRRREDGTGYGSSLQSNYELLSGRTVTSSLERATPRIVLSLTISPQGSRVRYYTVRLFYT